MRKLGNGAGRDKWNRRQPNTPSIWPLWAKHRNHLANGESGKAHRDE